MASPPVDGREDAMRKRKEREKDAAVGTVSEQRMRAAPVFTMDDLNMLDCAGCCQPLRLPIFQGPLNAPDSHEDMAQVDVDLNLVERQGGHFPVHFASSIFELPMCDLVSP
ncbi:hypothetical protein ZWY2020_058508 [Hordeum vulgare]|nr:hypothetical protein ZWY2020_058508 [Hordeum vulgare]